MSVDDPAAGTGRRAIFVYYKLAATRAPRLRQAHAALALRWPAWRPELMRRADADAETGTGTGTGESADGLQTWMEVYRLDDEQERDPARWRQLIEARARDAGILDLIDGDRHYEVFESCA